MKKVFFALVAILATFTAFCALTASAPLAFVVSVVVVSVALYMTNK